MNFEKFFDFEIFQPNLRASRVDLENLGLMDQLCMEIFF